jgi:hypothetical protein
VQPAADTERQARVLAAGCTLFLDQLQEAGVTARFRRGLIAASAPVALARGGVRELAASEAWAWVESLELVGLRWGAAGLRVWREAGLLADVPEWRLVGPQLDADMADELSRPDAPAPLALALQCYRTLPEAVGRLGRGPLAASLRSLSLEHCSIRRPACAALAAGGWRLAELSLDGNRVGDVGCDELSAAGWLPALSCLQASGCNIGQRGLKVLLRAGALRGLHKLDLSENRLGDDGARAIATSANLPNLRELSLAANAITETGAMALVASPHLDGLTRLSLPSNPFGRSAEVELEERFGRRVSV